MQCQFSFTLVRGVRCCCSCSCSCCWLLVLLRYYDNEDDYYVLPLIRSISNIQCWWLVVVVVATVILTRGSAVHAYSALLQSLQSLQSAPSQDRPRPRAGKSESASATPAPAPPALVPPSNPVNPVPALAQSEEARIPNPTPPRLPDSPDILDSRFQGARFLAIVVTQDARIRSRKCDSRRCDVSVSNIVIVVMNQSSSVKQWQPVIRISVSVSVSDHHEPQSLIGVIGGY